MPKQLRILWNSNSLWSTSGYAMQTAEVTPRIRDAGYPIANSNFFGQMGGKFVIDGIVQYPVINHTYGSDAMMLHGRDWNTDITISLQDAWILNPEDLQHIRRWVPWLPIDHDPIPSVVVDKLKFAHRIIAMSKFGQKQLQNKGFHATYIPHTVDTTIFKPMNKLQRRKDTGVDPKAFVVGMVGANKDNPPRKGFQEAMDAFKLFLAVEPNAILYVHTNPQMMGGFPLGEYGKFLGLTEKQLLFPDAYEMAFNVDKTKMNQIYNNFDVLLSPSVSEGFGIPIIEAQACGVPVIVNNWTAMPELVIPGETGEVAKIGSKWYSPQGSYMARVDTQDLFEQMVKVYKAGTGAYSKKAREHIVANYDTDTVFSEKWVPLLERIEREVYPAPSPTVAKAQQITI